MGSWQLPSIRSAVPSSSYIGTEGLGNIPGRTESAKTQNYSDRHVFNLQEEIHVKRQPISRFKLWSLLAEASHCTTIFLNYIKTESPKSHLNPQFFSKLFCIRRVFPSFLLCLVIKDAT